MNGINQTKDRKMNNVKRIIVLILLLFIASGMCFQTAYGADKSRWDEIISEFDLKETEFHKDEVVTCHQDDFELKYDIDAFDVSDDYVAVVLYPDFDSIKLCIFDSKMKIINKLSLDVPSGHCGVSIKGKNIVLFPIGTEYATEITQRGELVKMYTYKDRVINGVEKFATRSVEHKSGYTYYLTNNKNGTQKIGQPDSSPYLIRESKSGHREILYDCSKYHNRRTVSVVIIAIASLAIFGLGGYFQYIRTKRRYADKGNYEKTLTV